jgi:tRNA (cmo5U34)-methyltransferase
MCTWSDPAKASEYLERIGTLPPRLAGEMMLVDVMPASPRRVLDLGCGDGRLTALALEARPSVQEVVAVDLSPPMLEQARARFAGDPRVRIERWDLDDDVTALGRFDLVLSGFAIHHVPDHRKQVLFGEIATQLDAGGMFANLEVVASPTPELHATFRAAIGRVADDPEDLLADVESQLRWMRAAGMEQVDCLWKWRGFALLVGSARRSE